MASVHGCIGAVDPLRTFGSEEQKARLLPILASGKKISAFALTEPCAGFNPPPNSSKTAAGTRLPRAKGRRAVMIARPAGSGKRPAPLARIVHRTGRAAQVAFLGRLRPSGAANN